MAKGKNKNRSLNCAPAPNGDDGAIESEDGKLQQLQIPEVIIEQESANEIEIEICKFEDKRPTTRLRVNDKRKNENRSDSRN